MIKNFVQEDLIDNGGSSIIIHGRNYTFGQPVCVKILNQEFPTSDQSWYFENEYEFSKNNCTSLRKSLGQTTIENHKGIIFEYIDGTDLRKYMQSGSATFEQLLTIASTLANALAELHKENIIHNNICPENILIQNDTSKIFLIDLQIATRNSLKLVDTNSHILRKVSLSYIAPEQTGRINRIIDYRTDLYSLGVVLYEMFIGKLPFDSKDAVELIYSHVAKIPIPPNQLKKDLSPKVSAIVMKLLAKNAEDRYQSAKGVYYDLQNCLNNTAATDDNFTPGENDFSGKLYIHPKLYGKEKERKTLFQVFENCTKGSSELLLVAGYSGSGKTSLITELQKPVTDRKGFFMSGKFEQFQQDTPYSAFILAFRELINYFLTKDEQTLALWKQKIDEKVGALGKVLTDLIPEIEALTGKQPDIPQLKGAELQNRFNYVLGNFIKAIASKEHPIVIFIDDLQWADASSLNLFDLILSDKETKHIMLIGAYRDNEVAADHPVTAMMNRLRDKNVIFYEIQMVNLTENDVKNMVIELMRTNQDNSPELAELIHAKTKGNPFYIHQFLQSIFDEKKLYFDFDKKEWRWNAEEITQMNVSGNVADLMKSAINKLPERSIEILKVAACIGTRFDLHKLSIATKIGENTLQSILQEPLAEGFIISAAAHYKFAHDRIQQTIFSLIPVEEQKIIHLNIGRAITENAKKDDINELIFDLVNHWNIAVDILTDQEEKDYVANLDLLAGRKARASAAYQQAFLYFDKGLHLLAKDSWNNNYEFTLQLNEDAAEVAMLCGEMDLAEDLVNIIVANAKGLKDAIKAHEVKIQKLIAGNNNNAAISLGLDLLRQFGIKFPKEPGKLSVILGMIKINFLLGKKTSSFFEALPRISDPEKLATHRILSELLSAGYWSAPNLVPLLIFKMVELSVKDGLSPKSPFAFSAFGYILSAYMGKVDEGMRYGEIAINVSNQLKTVEQMPRILMTKDIFLLHWKTRLYDINDQLESAFKIGLETGDNEYTAYLAQNITYNAFYSGVPLHKLADRCEVLDQQIEKFRQDATLTRMRIFRQSIADLIYENTDSDILSGTIFDEQKILLKETSENYGYYHNLTLQKLVLAVIFNRNASAYTFAAACKKYEEGIKGSALELVHYFYSSLAITAIYNTADKKTQSAGLAKLKGNLKRLRRYESLCAENYQHKRVLVEAEYARITGNHAKARNLYDTAIKIAVEHHMIQDEAICWERAGQFYEGEKHEQVAQFYLINAMNAYQRWGADAKVRQMAVNYPELKKANTPKITDIFSKDPDNLHPVDIDMATIIKASTALSGEIVLSNLLKKLMQILREYAGAQQGFLILEKNSERVIEAEIIAETGDVTTLQSTPLNNCDTIAKSIVNYVTLKRETVLLDNAVDSTLFGEDEYIKRHQPKSILCAPLLNQGKLQGIIYLANDITAGAFTEKRLDFIRLLSGQIAISIENALFYDELEHRVEERTYELQVEKKKTDDLLLNILPKEVADELKNTGRSQARRYEQVSVLFTDFKSFTQHSVSMTPEELVGEVDLCFRKFDQIITKYRIEKIKTIGDAYLCVGGIPVDPDSPVRLVKAAIEMRDFILNLQKERQENNGIFFQMRIGINTGPVVAGIVGEKKFAYDIWGDTVNTAARMEQTGEVGKINISGITYELVKDKFEFTYRGKVSAKNKGEIDMYFVENEI